MTVVVIYNLKAMTVNGFYFKSILILVFISLFQREAGSNNYIERQRGVNGSRSRSVRECQGGWRADDKEAGDAHSS